jgi:hypothetical protein
MKPELEALLERLEKIPEKEIWGEHPIIIKRTDSKILELKTIIRELINILLKQDECK